MGKPGDFAPPERVKGPGWAVPPSSSPAQQPASANDLSHTEGAANIASSTANDTDCQGLIGASWEHGQSRACQGWVEYKQ
jgi:hypothetical protein